MEQYTVILFIPIGLLLASIGILEKNYMFGLDNYIHKLNKKHNVEIDKNAYCRFEGIQRVKTATGLLIIDVVFLLSKIKNLKTMIVILCIYGIIDLTLYCIGRKKFINKFKL